jgi:ribosome-associated protein
VGRRTPKPKPKLKSKSSPYSAPASRLTKTPRSRELIALEKLVLKALEDLKAVNIKVLDVRALTDVADTMIVASGTSDRHVRAIAESVVVQSKAAGRRPMGTEGEPDGEWVLVDLQDVLVHVMLPRVREFYALEQLWEEPQAQRRRSAAAPSRG